MEQGELVKKIKGYGFSVDTDICLKFLDRTDRIRIFKVSVGNNAEKECVKFSKGESVEVDDLDRNMIKLKLSIDVLDFKIRQIDLNLVEAKERAKAYLKNKQREMAKLNLQKKKKLENMQIFYETTKQQLESSLMNLSSMESNKSLQEVISACNKASQALKVNISDFDKTIEEANENKEYNKDIGEMLTQFEDQELEAEVDKEIEAMMYQQEQSEAEELPEPVKEVPARELVMDY